MAAEKLDVTIRTMRNWENGSTKIPYAAYRLMRMFGGYSITDKQWEGWSFWRGALWSPAGRGFEHHHLLYLGNYLWMARKFLADRQQAAVNPKPKTGLMLPAVAGGVNAATAAHGVAPRQNLHSLSFTVAGQQEKSAGSVMLGNYYQFASIDAAGKIAANDDIELEVL